VAYVAGHQLVLFHVETKTQRFIPGQADTEAITAIAFSQCKSYVAVAERAERGVITVYDLTTTTGSPRKRVLASTDVGSKVRIRDPEKPSRSSKLGRRARPTSHPTPNLSSNPPTFPPPTNASPSHPTASGSSRRAVPPSGT